MDQRERELAIHLNSTADAVPLVGAMMGKMFTMPDGVVCLCEHATTATVGGAVILRCVFYPIPVHKQWPYQHANLHADAKGVRITYRD